MLDKQVILYWIRRDLRISDNPALSEAVNSGALVVPVFIYDEWFSELGAAPKFRLEKSLLSLQKQYEGLGSYLLIKKGPAGSILRDLIKETRATSVVWARDLDPKAIARDTEIKKDLKANGISVTSYRGQVLFEPWTVSTKTGGFYRVYTPFWNSVRDRDVERSLQSPKSVSSPSSRPNSLSVGDLNLGNKMSRGRKILSQYMEAGELAAQIKLRKFLDGPVINYSDDRNIPQINGTSSLSDHLAWGEISPNQCWNSTFPMVADGVQGAETFLKELVWRDFAYHLIYHTPHIVNKNWREEWDAFPWRTDPNHRDVLAWKQGRTGIPFVDAAMREMYVTGRMHNRGRMIVASFLTKHLMTHWRIGLDWFSECLIDWDPASNAMGWQWSAGSGPDATPYFRVFNPVTQLQKFDPEGIYTKRWIAELSDTPSASSLAYFKAIPKHWKFDKESVYPSAITSPEEGRNRALEAYSTRGF